MSHPFNCISPRCNSGYEYKTASIASASSLTPTTNLSSELPSSSLHVASVKICEFLATLPSRSWLGKHIYNAVKTDDPSDKDRLASADNLWKILLECEGALKKLNLREFIHGRLTDEVSQLRSVLEKCWIKCCNILELSAAELIKSNPSFVRSKHFTLDSFVRMTIIHSYQDPTFRSRWARASNLMVHTCSKASPFVCDLKYQEY